MLKIKQTRGNAISLEITDDTGSVSRLVTSYDVFYKLLEEREELKSYPHLRELKEVVIFLNKRYKEGNPLSIINQEF